MQILHLRIRILKQIYRFRKNILLFLAFLIVINSINSFKNFNNIYSFFNDLTIKSNNLESTNYISNYYTTKNDTKIHILFSTSFWNVADWELGAETVSHEYLDQVNCPVNNCVFTSNKNYLQHTTDYDALIYHVAQSKSDSKWVEPKIRRASQIFVMADQESPMLTGQNLAMYNNFFNMTLTYRLDSDVLWSYGMVQDIETNAIIAPSRTARWRKPEPVNDPKILKLIESKDKMATWFVSHCNAFSNRDLLAEKLKLQFIDVATYGKCGDLVCPRDNAATCEVKLNTTYKFYLAFENSICVDYITEKVFNYMQNYIIPVVYSGVSNMQHFLPPHSYINVNDFKTVEELANYLKFLDKNPQEYANYFWWKKYYKIILRPDNYTFCNMCVKLNEFRDQRKRQEYPELDIWYNYKTCKDTSKAFVD